jgi:hypothetical protein
MGHERVGTLPRSLRWESIVNRLSTGVLSAEDVRGLARDTLSLVRARLRAIEGDAGVRAAFAFLVTLASSARPSETSGEVARSLEVPTLHDFSPFGVVVAGHSFVDSRRESLEYGGIAKAALGDAVAEWHRAEQAQPSLFDARSSDDSLWRRASTGSGFCELSRLFFARFTERYLNYFLERAASQRMSGLGERDRFATRLRQHVDEVSQHAFETAQITQSFAAGWFNRHVPVPDVSDDRVRDFLSVAFGKLRDELLRESDI